LVEYLIRFPPLPRRGLLPAVLSRPLLFIPEEAHPTAKVFKRQALNHTGFNVFGYKSFFSQAYFIEYALPLFQRLELYTLQLAKVEKYIFPSIAGDKTISMSINQSFHNTSGHDIFTSLQEKGPTIMGSNNGE
jgi:hypothetical protein